VALVVAAEELALVLALPDQEQQVAVGGLHVEDGDLGLGPRLFDDLEELALAVGLHVQGDDARRAAAPRRAVGDLEPLLEFVQTDRGPCPKPLKWGVRPQRRTPTLDGNAHPFPLAL
jgi:hypothetical protein